MYGNEVLALPVFTSIFIALAGCSSGGGGGLGGASTTSDAGAARSSSSNTPSASSTQGSSRPEGATHVTCKSADDCGNWFCDCTDGPVNGRNCTNGYCLDAAHTCPSACAKFGVQWTGTASGGPSQPSGTSTSTPTPTQPQPSDECTVHKDCPEIDCTCTSGFNTQPVTIQSCDRTTHKCRPESEACPDACATQGLQWTGS